jgi:choline monooxygenase
MSVALTCGGSVRDTGDVAQLIAAGKTLPSEWYTSPQIFQLELRQIFRRAWEYIGSATRVAAKGDFFTTEVGGVPIVVVRDHADTIRAFINVCRHRHHTVVQGCGNRSRFTCPYHAWTYRLDGSLLTAPRCESDPAFQASTLGLSPVSVETWGDMIFVNVSAGTTSLDEALGPIKSRVQDRGLPVLQATLKGSRSITFAANWKLVWDNNCECYHCATIHPSWYRQVRLGPDHLFDRRIGPSQYELEVAIREDHPSEFVYYAWPAICVNSVSADYVCAGDRSSHAAGVRCGYTMTRFVPQGPALTRVDLDIFGIDSLSFEEAEAMLDSISAITIEDKGPCETMQRSHDFGCAQPGTLIRGLDTEDQTLLWERLVHRTITSPDVSLYAPLDFLA